MNKKTLTEKITLKLEETLRSNLIKITEGFYKEVTNSGITVKLLIIALPSLLILVFRQTRKKYPTNN